MEVVVVVWVARFTSLIGKLVIGMIYLLFCVLVNLDLHIRTFIQPLQKSSIYMKIHALPP